PRLLERPHEEPADLLDELGLLIGLHGRHQQRPFPRDRREELVEEDLQPAGVGLRPGRPHRGLDRVAPLARRLKDRRVHEVVLGAEVVADGRQVRARGGGDVARRGAAVPLLDEALLGSGQQVLSLSHGGSLAFVRTYVLYMDLYGRTIKTWLLLSHPERRPAPGAGWPCCSCPPCWSRWTCRSCSWPDRPSPRRSPPPRRSGCE